MRMIQTDPKDTIKRVLERNHYDKNVFDIDSFFAGSYDEMAQISDFLYSSGYDFLYDPRKLTIDVENLGDWFFYRILDADDACLTSGFESSDYDDSTDDELRFHIKEKWAEISKPYPNTEAQYRIQRYMAVPRDIVLTHEEADALDVRADDFCGCVENVTDGLMIKAEFMTLFRTDQFLY